MQRQITVTISNEGDVEVKVSGQAGPGCKALTKQLESALGQTTEGKTTPDYHLPETQNQQQFNNN